MKPSLEPPESDHPGRVVILAGGGSSRMGSPKQDLPFGPRSVLQHIHLTAQSLGWPVEIQSRDLVPQQGPLGGILTAVQHFPASLYLFLACDMPLLSASTLDSMRKEFLQSALPSAYLQTTWGLGFPLFLRNTDFLTTTLQTLLSHSSGSLHQLRQSIPFHRLSLPPHLQHEALNMNTPEDYQEILSHIN